MLTSQAGRRPWKNDGRDRQRSPALQGSSYRVLIYSHDSFGLGHLRRCRAIAHALVEGHKKLNVLIVSGSPIIGRFSFPSRVDFVRVPGIIKLRSGGYTSLNLHINIEDTLALRASIIEHTAQVFDPHLFLVDKEPLGLLGEVRKTLGILKRRGRCRLVLGLRDIMDEPMVLAEEWRRKGVMPALERLFDHIWVYGHPEIYDPVTAYELPPQVAAKTVFTGYLRRAPQPEAYLPHDVAEALAKDPHLLVTTGGGGDGAEMVDAALSAYEQFNGLLPWPAIVVYGPFLPANRREEFERRAAKLPRVTTLTFHEHLENLMEKVVAVVSLGGYNTFCEILSLDKRSVIIPRVRPRAEQLLRAEAAHKQGLVQVLLPDRLTPETLTEAVLRLPDQPPPAGHRIPGLLDGLRRINAIVEQWHLASRGRQRPQGSESARARDEGGGTSSPREAIRQSGVQSFPVVPPSAGLPNCQVVKKSGEPIRPRRTVGTEG